MENENNNVENNNENLQPEIVETSEVQPTETVEELTPVAPTPVVVETQTTTNNNIGGETPKKNNKLFIIVGAIAVIGILLLIIPNLFNSGKKVVQKQISNVFSMAKKAIDESENSLLKFDLNKETLGVEGTFSIDSNYKDASMDLTKLKNYKFGYSGVIDKKSNEASFNVSLAKDKPLLSFDGYVNGKKAYISLGDLFNKVITSNIDGEIKDIDISTNGSTKDIKTILNKTEGILKNFVKSKDIKKSKENGLTKVEYTFDVIALEKALVKGYKNDKDILKILSKLTGQSTSDIKSAFESSLKDTDGLSFGVNITAIIYLDGSNVKEIDLDAGVAKLIIKKEGEVYNYSLEASGQKIFSGKYDEKNQIFTLESDMGISLKTQKKNDETTLEFSYSMGGQVIKLNMTMKNSVTSTKQDNKTNIEVQYNDIKASISSDMKIEKNKKVSKIDNTNTVDVESISDEELQKIYMNIYEKVGNVIMEIMPGAMNGSLGF